MQLKTALQLNLPYRFEEVCDIYPISLEYAISFSNEEEFINMFMPYMLSKEVIVGIENIDNVMLFDIVLSNKNLFINLADTLEILCKTENIKINTSTCEIFIGENVQPLNRENFDRFSDIILEMILAKRLEKEEIKEPVFETERGRERWLQLQENRAKEKKKLGTLKIYDVINTVQFGMQSYISDKEILLWSYWKLMKSYYTILNKQRYRDNFDVYLQCGEKELIEKHWSELIKL